MSLGGTPSYSGALTFGDVDGDGDLDLLATNEPGSGTGRGAVSVRLNNGSGTFGGTREVGIGYSPSSVKLGDLDGDGDLDLLATNAQSNTVSVRFNRTVLATATGHIAANWVVFPNPARTAATLTGAAPYAPLTVFDALGRVLLTATADATGTARLALPTALPTGVYAVRSGGLVCRLVVE